MNAEALDGEPTAAQPQPLAATKAKTSDFALNDEAPRPPPQTAHGWRIARYTALWYLLSTTLSLYNKYFLGKSQFGFPFPMFMATVHMASHFVCAAAVLQWILPQLRPTRWPSARDYALRVFPCSVATGLDISLSNASLQTISLGFYTMVKSSAPVVVLLFAFALRLERPTWKLVGVMAVICVGTACMVVHQPGFDARGFAMVVTATLCSGLRWTITQMLLQRPELGMSNPVATMFFLTPLMALTLGVMTLVFEGAGAIAASEFLAGDRRWATFGMVAIGGVLAFAMTMAEYKLIAISSVVTFSVLGILKEILTILVSHAIFRDQFTALNLVGLAISLCGIAMYHALRIQQMRSSRQSEWRMQTRGARAANEFGWDESADVRAGSPVRDWDGDDGHDPSGDLADAYRRSSALSGENPDDSLLTGIRNSLAQQADPFGYAPLMLLPHTGGKTAGSPRDQAVRLDQLDNGSSDLELMSEPFADPFGAIGVDSASPGRSRPSGV